MHTAAAGQRLRGVLETTEFDQVWRNTTTVDVELWNPDTAATITHPQMTAESRPSASRLPDLVFQPAKGWRNAGSEAIVDRR